MVRSPKSGPTQTPKRRSVPVTKLPATIRENRLRMEWSQAQLAEFLGVTQVTVARWEGGSRFPQGEHLGRLARLFRITWRDL